MRKVLSALVGTSTPRGLSQIATLILAALVVFVCWNILHALIGAVVGMLAMAIQIAVMILVFMIIVYAIKAMTKKV